MIIVYYGDGKGKTTAALGIALRSLGRGMTVAVLQFIKGDHGSGSSKDEGVVAWTSGEREVGKKFGIVEGKFLIKAVGEGFFGIEGDKLDPEKHRQAADSGMEEAEKIVREGKYKVVILDEVIRALDEGLVDKDQLFNLIDNAREQKIHLVMTGHRVDQDLVERVDLVTEMKKVKHPFDRGVFAEIGIDY